MTGVQTCALPICKNLDGANMDKYKLRDYGCHSCPVRCGAVVEIKEGPFATEGETHRPEYETLAALGSFCLTDNVESVIRANEICNLYGLDTIAAGVAVAFAMECYENGLIGKEETDGIELTWGNAEAMIAVLEKLARREGFGAILADGAEKAAERIGKGSENMPCMYMVKDYPITTHEIIPAAALAILPMLILEDIWKQNIPLYLSMVVLWELTPHCGRPSWRFTVISKIKVICML